ncbi:TetR/AcrR family transcriptional regulator [Mycobacterium sp. CVI_P3]|uniref:TetR/AcrR family transcriptional regulator n=1 Tax=Mycobacterium pinniadriaticum TaxID=2994102 RepID=A0ABT3SKK6_9MYCO|nr:TetR/AcrR family transcriptional regulator [Mycobacterium pinniadriaticum]MCX2933662.1 TetR/AcrR family transcriptional regulator [Mycobacterium pinniadriaticum]MCX2940051.1 TetR/AcrR family transcriptional regulator [Mycobacterium pinniadriaticum]
MPRGATRVDRRELTRRALIEAAIKRFADNGISGTTVTDIAGDVGVTERTFYRHFASKEEVLFADYDDHIEWFRRALEVRPRGEPITRSVRAAMNAFPMDHRIVTETARLRSSELSEQQIAVHMQRVQALLGAEIERHLKATTFSEPEDEPRAAVTAAMIAAAIFAAMAAWSRCGDSLQMLGPMVEQALETVERGIGTV